MTPEQMAEIISDAIEVATAPLVVRLAAAEAKIAVYDGQSPLKDLGALRERIAVQEARTEPLIAKMANLDALPLVGQDIVDGLQRTVSELRVKVAEVEARAPIAGPPGPPGPIGPMGVKGETGLMGPAGPMGDKGLDGMNGRDGIDGAVGPVGPQGEKGMDGLHGKDGRDGIDGKDGAPGLAGKDGIDGINGKDGAPGMAGKDGRDGIDGKDGSPGLQGKDGRDGINGKDGVDGLHGKDGAPGADGHSVSVEDVASLIAREVQQQVKSIPAPKDGVGIANALINLDGVLVLTFTDGSVKDVAVVVGKDGRDGMDGKSVDMGAVAELITKELDSWPRPKDGRDGIDGKDGRDGLSFTSAELFLEDDKGWVIRLVNGEIKSEPLVIPFTWDAGIWKHSVMYPKGAGVTSDGAYWIALRNNTGEKPTYAPSVGPRAWRLAVKPGRDGKPGKDGRKGGDES